MLFIYCQMDLKFSCVALFLILVFFLCVINNKEDAYLFTVNTADKIVKIISMSVPCSPLPSLFS